jgi:HEPN domain-containing protein
MELDPVLVVDAKGWLVKAANDLRGAQLDLAAHPPLLEDALFHCQQAVEKAFKAFLTFHQLPFRKTHNLEELGVTCLQVDRTLKSLVDEVVPLTEYAWAFRYPGNPPAPQQDEAQAAFELAQKLNQAILSRLPSATHP